MKNTKSLDDIFEVKLDDKQQGYLWAKLSPKSKKEIKSLLLSTISTLKTMEKKKEKLDKPWKNCPYCREPEGAYHHATCELAINHAQNQLRQSILQELEGLL